MSDIKIVQTTVKRKPSRERGPFSSEEFNDFQDQVTRDLIELSSAANTNANKIVRALIDTYSENSYLKRRIASLERANEYKEFVSGKFGTKLNKYVDFHNSEGIFFPENLSGDKAESYKGQFGELSLPLNAVENKFFNFSLRTREVITPDDFSVDVVGVFDKSDGNGIVDYEKGGDITKGEPRNAFNGINETTWARQVTFPLESDVDEVEVQLTAVVPAGISSQANLIEVVPFPEGSTDITGLSTSPDLGSAFQSIDNFEEENNVPAKRYHFSPRNVEQIRITIRSRNWREMDGKKVFLYGLRELGLKLVDYKKDYTAIDSFGQNFTTVVKIDAPDRHVFSTLYRIDPTPNFLSEDANSRHIRLRLSTTADFSGVFWDSSVDIPPQVGVSTGVAMGGASSIFAIYTFKFIESSGGFSSPYPIGTTPTANGLGLVYLPSPTDANK